MGGGPVVAATGAGHERGRVSRLDLTYVLPLRSVRRAPPELTAYLGELVQCIDDVVVVDGSPEPVRAAHAAAWPARVRQLPVDPAFAYANGKVNGVLTGLGAARHDTVVLADDDVRYDRAGLAAVARLLEVAHAVMPQNYYAPLTWPAAYDTSRVLVQRALRHDFAGTVGVRRHLLARTGGYDGDVLFENLELMRTVAAAGGVVRYEPGLYVRRLSPEVRHFLGQRVRQAYDEFARPAHLAAALAVVPGVVSLVVGRRWRALGAAGVGCALVAERGRRRAGGRAYFPVRACLLAPAWVVERGVCAWVAAGWWLAGGVPYAGRRLRRAANSPRRLHGVHTGEPSPIYRAAW